MLLRSYSPATLIGNWYEERIEQSDRLARALDPTLRLVADCDPCMHGESMRRRMPLFDMRQVACERCRDRQMVRERLYKSCMKQVISMSPPSRQLSGLANRVGGEWTEGVAGNVDGCDLCRFGERMKQKMPVYDWATLFRQRRLEMEERIARRRLGCMRLIMNQCP